MVDSVRSLELNVADELELESVAASVARLLPRRLTVGLVGQLGAGKTRFVQGVATASGVAKESVTSPTFVICQHYHGTLPLRHVDLYRVADEDEFWELGAEEWFADEGVTLIEWADRFAGCLPRERLDLEISITGETRRQLMFVARGEDAEVLLERLAAGAGGRKEV